MVELPIMPGESRPDEQPIPFDPKPQTVALESQIDSLRDEVVDLVALRARLESRMKARLEGEDWNGLDSTLKEFARLTPRDQFAQRLGKLKDDAAHQQAELKKPILTKTAQAQISDLQAMIDRYLDDETYRAYADALERAQGRPGCQGESQGQESRRGGRRQKAGCAGGRRRPPTAKAAPAAAGCPRRRARPAPPKSTVPF